MNIPRLSSFLLLTLTTLATAALAPACAVATGDEPDTAEAEDPLTFTVLPGDGRFTALAKPPRTGPPDLTVIRSASQHVSFFGTSAPGVDFSREWVVSYRPVGWPSGTKMRIVAHPAGATMMVVGVKDIPGCLAVTPIGDDGWVYGKISATPAQTPQLWFDRITHSCSSTPPVINPALACGAGQIARLQNGYSVCEVRPATCINVLCPSGTLCGYASDGRASCLSTVTPPSPCASARCPIGTECTLTMSASPVCMTISKTTGGQY